ncbi:MAG TPA: DHHA1 domain-containing protein [Vicinamibacterales bacterium]|jgi:alanyl-tRNA synthetase|nr:DHHA1 domain-containing protein [Vicinamibacterales bacterium]
MTDRLYYTDPYLREFDAIVTQVDPHERGLAIRLDRSAFYPTSGGQPFDVGTLAGHRVVDVFDDDDGGVTHVVDGKAADVAPGGPVHGSVDWPRRFDHMQQHTGQHVLSAAFERLFKVRTVSFHLGAEASTIDLSRDVSSAEIAAAEDDANRIVWEDRPVSIRFASAEEAAALPLRKEPARTGTLRLIDVEAYDLSACGGTHVGRTGAIGIIAVASSERFKGGARIGFVCGGRALSRFRLLRDGVDAAARVLSVGLDGLTPAVERLQADLKDQRRTIAAQQTELARYRAEEIAAGGEVVGGVRLVASAVEADAAGLKALASAVTAASSRLAVLVSSSRPALVVIARSADVSAKANDILAALIGKFGGRGGGKPDIAQGGGLDADPARVVQEARDAAARVLKGGA